MVDADERRAPAGRVDAVADRDAAAAAMEARAPGYLERVRREAARLAVRSGGDGGARAALADLAGAANIDTNPPVVSSDAARRLAKDVTKRMVAWYLRYVGDQLTVMGQATVRLGTALVDRTETLEARVEKLTADVTRLSSRLEQAERDGR